MADISEWMSQKTRTMPSVSKRTLRDVPGAEPPSGDKAALAGLFGRPYPSWDVYPTWELDEAWRELLAARARLEIPACRTFGQGDRADEHAGLQRPVRTGPEQAAAIGPARRFVVGDHLHGLQFWRAGDRTRREGGEEGVPGGATGLQAAADTRDQVMHVGEGAQGRKLRDR